MLARARSLAATLLGVLALAVQGLVVQTHIEGLAGLGAGAAQHAAAGASAGGDDSPTLAARAPAETPAACLVCQEIARAGVSVLALTPVLGVVEGSGLSSIAVTIARAPRTFAAHAWQSRAPPLF